MQLQLICKEYLSFQPLNQMNTNIFALFISNQTVLFSCELQKHAYFNDINMGLDVKIA